MDISSQPEPDRHAKTNGANGIALRISATSAPQPRPNGQAADAVGIVLRSDKGKPIELSGGPYDYAQAFLDARHDHKEGRTLHFYRGAFHAWTGAHYRELVNAEVRTELYDFLDAALVWRVKKGKPEPQLVPFKPNRSSIDDIVDALRARAFLPYEAGMPSWLEGKGPSDLIPLRNGLLDRAGHLHPHSPRYFGAYSLPFDYDPTPSPPFQWLRFLKGLWPKDREARRTLQETIGLLLTADTQHQKIFLLVGPKRSGKGTIARIIRQLLGPDNVAGPTLGGLATNFGSQCLIGKPAAIISDARLSSRSDAAIIAERLLSISGEDVQTVDRKHRDPWTGMLPTRFVVLTNELPKISDASGALASRFIILTLSTSFYGREDHGLLDRLLAELPGIFAWALVGRRRLAKRGRFVMPKSSEAAVERLELLSSPITSFVRDQCFVKPGATIPCKVLYDHWRAWCEQQGRDHPGTLQSFGNDLHAVVPGLGVRQVGTGTNRWRAYDGIRLRYSCDGSEAA